jgi:hypothetical protein
MLYTGLDFHRNFTYITTMSDNGEIIGQKKLLNNGEIIDYLKEFEAIHSSERNTLAIF